MNYTEAEIKLCRRLHDLGVRSEIREGDWIDRVNSPGEISLSPENLINFYNDPAYRDNFILLWSWKRARERLRERGWRIMDACDKINGGLLMYMRTHDKASGISTEGQTDLEAILAAMAQVAEEEKP